MENLFAVAAPGLEPFVAQELAQLGLLDAASAQKLGAVPPPGPATPPEGDLESGGIEFAGGLKEIYRANLHLRIASRVLLRFGQFHAAAFSELRRRASQLAWERFLQPAQPLAIRVTCHKSRLYHSSAVARELAVAIGERLNKPPELVKFEEGGAAQLVIVRLVNDDCTLSIDTSGALLHRRGYRLETAKAPLRETLAAAMLDASGWDRQSPLLDPFCGSGTIPIEAALAAMGVAPGASRRFAFMDWPAYQAELWQALLAENAAYRQTLLAARPAPRIMASDRDAGAIKISRANAARAGVEGSIEFSCRAVSSIEPGLSPGWVVTNPPYGLRVSQGKDLRNLYAQFGNVLRLHCPGWQVGILSSDPALLRQTGLSLETLSGWNNGGTPVRLARCRIPLAPSKEAGAPN